MYEEPYRWIEAVGNRRHYLDEQFTKGAPVVALAYADGILMLTVSRGTPKLYEIYDRIALGGADVHVLRPAHEALFQRPPGEEQADAQGLRAAAGRLAAAWLRVGGPGHRVRS